ncbi:MAG: hypothetical protein U0768_16765 [Anaerolineae bacterium]
MRYIHVRWIHEHPDEPVDLYSELTDDGWEVRKVEIFADGSATFANRTSRRGTSRLGQTPTPSLAEINANPQFQGRAIDKDEFEAVWSNAVAQ